MSYAGKRAWNRRGRDVFTAALRLLSITLNGLLRLLALGLVRFYQASLSPMFPAACRHYPSCSAYAYEAVEKWGVWKGGLLALGRLLRCRPWGSFGYDPVPEKQGLGTGEIKNSEL